ncbi:MAG: hypothetical protein HY332_04505 [Chloroflexi bacterium]|nr:hypothetical protein [Chloroflexota bacterium]
MRGWNRCRSTSRCWRRCGERRSLTYGRRRTLATGLSLTTPSWPTWLARPARPIRCRITRPPASRLPASRSLPTRLGWSEGSSNGPKRPSGRWRRSAVAPWGVFASLPFAPEIVLPAIGYFLHRYPAVAGHYCFRCSINPTFSTPPWLSQYHFGINLGPIVLMVENYRSGLVWRLMQRCPSLVAGLRRAGFTGGWL